MTTHPDLTAAIEQAAEVISSAEALLIGAGAGMGVDSGMPDFRGPEGFWQAYPPFRGRQFAEMSNPTWFREDPELAWGFFGHRLNLYRATTPHQGFEILRSWGEQKPGGCFVFTSNVDGHFQKAGFAEEQILEAHGSIHYLQCSRLCCRAIWSAEDLQITVEETTIRATSPLPRCRHCHAIARPNILMFGDMEWISSRCSRQQQNYGQWLRKVSGRQLAIIELGAGTAVPTVRSECERHPGNLIRINLRDPEVPPDSISLPLGAWEALRRIEERLR